MKIPEFCSVGGARSKTAFFAFLRYLPVFCAQSKEIVLPQTNGADGKPRLWKYETLKVCLLLVWRVCDQTFGRYRPLKGAEKWSRDQ